MAGWYRVTKTIKGHQYIYEQQTYREGGHVRTRNRYIGPAGDQGSSGSGGVGQSAVTTTAEEVLRGVGDFGKAMVKQFDVDQWEKDVAAQLDMGTAKPVTTTKRRHSDTVGAHRRSKKKTWFIKDHSSKRAIGEQSHKKVFLGYIDGKKYYSVGRASKYFAQRPPEGEVWDYE